MSFFVAADASDRQNAVKKRCLRRNQLDPSGLNVEPIRAIYFWKGLSPTASGRPLDLKRIAGQLIGVKVAFAGERDDAFSALLPDFSYCC
jgi:hypothetical protein